MGLELLAEAGNYAAFQRLYGGASPYLSAWPYAAAAAAQTPHGAPPSAIDIYYRQAAAAAALQKPALPASYMYPSRMPPGMTLPGMPPPPGASLGAYYAPQAAPAAAAAAAQLPPPPPSLPGRDRSPATSHSANSEADYERSSSSRQRLLTPSPPLNPGSPPPRRAGGEELHGRRSCSPGGAGQEQLTGLSPARAHAEERGQEQELEEQQQRHEVLEEEEDEDDEELALEV